MFCKNCGAKLENRVKFCVNCGWQVGSDVTKSKIKNVSGIKIPVILIIGVIGIIVIGFVVKNLFFGGSSLVRYAKKVKVVTEYSTDTLIDDMDTVTFGSYPQSDTSGDKKDPIEWLVLEKSDSEMLLLSKYVLDCKCYNDEYKDVTWETCTLRHWLNDIFYNKAFSDDEKESIIKSNVVNKGNSEYGTLGGNDTSDYIYSLSIDECRKYFSNEDKANSKKRLATKGTEYAKNVDNYGDKLWIDGSNSACGFWLRSPGNKQKNATYVFFGGSVFDSGLDVDYYSFGIRPLIKVRYK